MKITFKNQVGAVKTAKVGFSWTVLFFGWLPALFRGDVKGLIIMFATQLLVGMATFFMFSLPALLVPVVFAFIYNKMYIRGLMEKGYAPVDQQGYETLKTKGMVA